MKINHNELRQIAKTLNAFCIIEVSVVIVFTYFAYDLLQWYKHIVTPQTFNGVAFWGAIGSISASIFGACKHINETFKTNNNN